MRMMKDDAVMDENSNDDNIDNNHTNNTNKSISGGSKTVQVAMKSPQPARSLQPLEPIVGSTPVKDYPKCFVHIKPCYPFGMANVEEQMLVVTPEDNLSLYEDAVVSTSHHNPHSYLT